MQCVLQIEVINLYYQHMQLVLVILHLVGFIVRHLQASESSFIDFLDYTLVCLVLTHNSKCSLIRRKGNAM
jgi:hypothetical protein